MNTFIKNTLLSGLLTTVAIQLQAAPSVSLGDDAILFLTLSGGIEHQSNTTRQKTNEESEMIFTVTPGVELQLGTENAAYLEATLGLEVRVHDDLDNLDGEYIRFNSLGYYDTGVALFKGYASANELGTNSVDFSTTTPTADLAERSDVAIGGSVNYLLSDQVSLSGGVDYLHRSFNDASLLAGSDAVSVPLRVLYAFDPAVSAFVGYRYRTASPFNAPAGSDIPDTEDHYIFGGIEGEIFNPLWTGSIDLGYQTRDFDGSALIGGSSSTFSYNARLNYAADTNWNVYGALSRDFGQGTSDAAISYTRDQISIGTQYLISEMWLAGGNLTLAKTEFEDTSARKGRVDHLVSASASVTWSPNEYVRITGAYKINDLNYDFINPAFDEYKNTVFSLTASVRY
jgi:hypothetical protein|tara:strand:+ start:2083 stop:3282 length:1200 start_codon:yes stop_codon:yes gene_type:complete